jgi:thiol-disulfide isomerase/thioredoxin
VSGIFIGGAVMIRASATLVSLLGFASLVHAAEAPVGDGKRGVTVDHYRRAVTDLRAFTADITREDSAGKAGAPVSTATLAFARPNLFKLVVSQNGQPVETVASDGRTLRQWNDQHLGEEPAPPALNGLAPSLDRANSEFWATAVFTMPELVTSLRDLQDDGAELLGDATTRKLRGRLHYGDDAAVLTVWVGDRTGLPLRVAFVHRNRTVTWRFKARADKPAPSLFAARPAPDAHLAPLLRNDQFPGLANGAVAPAFTLQTVDGHKVALSDLAGQVVLVEFWAPWCPGCRLAAPTVGKVSAELAPRGMRALLVSTTAERQQLVDYLHERTPPAAVVHDPAPQDEAVGYARYKITGFPSFVVVDRAGFVSGSWKGYYEGSFEVKLRAELNRALAKPQADAHASR